MMRPLCWSIQEQEAGPSTREATNAEQGEARWSSARCCCYCALRYVAVAAMAVTFLLSSHRQALMLVLYRQVRVAAFLARVDWKQQSTMRRVVAAALQ